jgi:hypothetical protein
LDDILGDFRENLIQPAKDWFERKKGPSESEELAAARAEIERLKRELEKISPPS